MSSIPCGYCRENVELFELQAHLNVCPVVKERAESRKLDLETARSFAQRERLERIATAVLAGYCASTRIDGNEVRDAIAMARALIAALDSEAGQ